MTKSADENRWTIVPPPSQLSSALSEEFQIRTPQGRRYPARSAQDAGEKTTESMVFSREETSPTSGVVARDDFSIESLSSLLDFDGSQQEMDAEDWSEGVTRPDSRSNFELQPTTGQERPTFRDTPLVGAAQWNGETDCSEVEFETIPAPPLCDDTDE